MTVQILLKKSLISSPFLILICHIFFFPSIPFVIDNHPLVLLEIVLISSKDLNLILVTLNLIQFLFDSFIHFFIV